MLAFPVVEAEELAGLWLEEGFGITVHLELNEVLVIFARGAIFQRNLWSTTRVDQRSGGAVAGLKWGSVFHQTILVLGRPDSLAKPVEIGMIFGIVFLNDALALNGLRSAVYWAADLDVGTRRACKDFRRPCIPTSHY